MKEVLRAHGVPVARSALARSPASCAAFVGQVGLPVIVKPQAGLGARATYRVETATELRAALTPRRRGRCRSRSSCARASTPARR